MEVELEAENPVLRHLIVGERLLELVDALEEVLADLGHRPDLQLLDDVLDVGAALGVAEALLVEKGDLVVENVQLFQKLILRDRNLKKSLFYYGSVADPDPGSGAFLTPGSGMGKSQDPDPG